VQAIEAATANLQVSIRRWQLTANIFDHQVACQFLILDSMVSQNFISCDSSFKWQIACRIYG
jgi:hypothetical protein